MSTRWTPDTCANLGCVFDIYFNNSGGMALKNVVSKCKDHAGLDDQTAFNNAHKENSIRMDVVRELVKHDPTLIKLNERGEQIIDTTCIDSTYDKDRKLSVFFGGKTINIEAGQDVVSIVSGVINVD